MGPRLRYSSPSLCRGNAMSRNLCSTDHYFRVSFWVKSILCCIESNPHTGWKEKNGPPCHTKFDLFSIVLGKSDETMPYRLDLGNSFAVVYIAVTCLVQELY